jgi:hypothetical protein
MRLVNREKQIRRPHATVAAPPLLGTVAVLGYVAFSERKRGRKAPTTARLGAASPRASSIMDIFMPVLVLSLSLIDQTIPFIYLSIDSRRCRFVFVIVPSSIIRSSPITSAPFTHHHLVRGLAVVARVDCH